MQYSAHTDQCTYHFPVYVGIMISPWYRTFQHQSSSSTQTLKQPNNLLLNFVCQLNHLAFITWVIFHIFKICFRVKSSEKCHKCLQIKVSKNRAKSCSQGIHKRYKKHEAYFHISWFINYKTINTNWCHLCASRRHNASERWFSLALVKVL